ncbi:crotonase/enoyl-CoA hydratase family protein [Roseibium litorale]|uniref:Crotonase/enoyl-CoA hydratase family protein n=1 Tax=Roseibium litorale TaxID=2803841 RepID=A0ABR9CQK8_9HYPH|nr:crotonase/enoyl-CoA hydratase family protein [Roseibium litorale]MBD8893120.1 crotonase/enoyl-CoA hydratase family protein [Roseibium litorale]
MIQHEMSGGVSTLRLDRADKKNALTGDMYNAMSAVLEAGNDDKDLRCHVICGQPGAFTAGNDIADFLKYASQSGLEKTPVVRFLKALGANRKPLVAAVDGLAIGIGTTLLFHCDMVFATPGSLFKTPFVDLGLVPEAGSSLLGPAVMGHARAFELLCLGESFDAARAQEAGIVNHVGENAEELAMDCARKIASKPPEAMALSRALLRGDRTLIDQRIEEEARIFGTRLSVPETIGAFQAFMTKKTTASKA